MPGPLSTIACVGGVQEGRRETGQGFALLTNAPESLLCKFNLKTAALKKKIIIILLRRTFEVVLQKET